MKLRSFVTLIAAFAVFTAQRSRACSPSCASNSTTSQQVVNKTIERVLVSGVEEAQWRGMCHSFCVTVSCFMLQIYHVTSVQLHSSHWVLRAARRASIHCQLYLTPGITLLPDPYKVTS